MTQLDEAVARYHKHLEAEPSLAWAQHLQEQMRAHHMAAGGRLVCPVLRPHLITHRQYAALVKAAESLYAAIDRVKRLALENPPLLSRMELLPAEKMLASVEPGYPHVAVGSLLDTQLNNGSMHFLDCHAESAAGVSYSDALSNLFFDSPPMKDMRKRYKVTRVGGSRRLLHALLAAYKTQGKRKFPRIAIVEMRQPFQSAPSGDYLLLAESFRQAGYPTEVISPEQLEYRGGVLRRGDFPIDLVFRRVSVQEFLLRFDLSHPLVRAYRDGAVCVVNSFRAELAQKRAIFDLLTDATVTAGFPTVEKKAIRDHIPWTRVVAARDTAYGDRKVDLLEFILRNRQKLVLKPNDETTEQQMFRGWETDDAGWERALRTAMRSPYVAQERVEPTRALFPVLQFDRVQLREMQVDVHPHVYMGKVSGCSSRLSDAVSGFSTLAGLAPTFILETKS